MNRVSTRGDQKNDACGGLRLRISILFTISVLLGAIARTYAKIAEKLNLSNRQTLDDSLPLRYRASRLQELTPSRSVS
ncbi:hypothetical protein LC613_14395 [Nostoc sphaeroides CHAB 2801]|uniref:hypothetical protein n=1 Tax=Nostoc sphaeroides TaxID=446679 RepID=UPI0011C138C8|nr:hypothetical protein [Nostoc sphaeroides]MCC5629196.1 hypothetical protein [Nostoc sphaeroides CHAB 2801]